MKTEIPIEYSWKNPAHSKSFIKINMESNLRHLSTKFSKL